MRVKSNFGENEKALKNINFEERFSRRCLCPHRQQIVSAGLIVCEYINNSEKIQDTERWKVWETKTA